MKQLRMTELQKVSKDKIGHVNYNDVCLEAGEKATFEFLTLFGLNLEIIRPTNTKMAKNPDAMMLGVIWEAKTPTSANRNTIRNRFRNAARQATNIIFDLRFVKGDADTVEKQVLAMFEAGGKVRRLIIVEKSGRVLDIHK